MFDFVDESAKKHFVVGTATQHGFTTIQVDEPAFRLATGLIRSVDPKDRIRKIYLIKLVRHMTQELGWNDRLGLKECKDAVDAALAYLRISRPDLFPSNDQSAPVGRQSNSDMCYCGHTSSQHAYDRDTGADTGRCISTYCGCEKFRSEAE